MDPVAPGPDARPRVLLLNCPTPRSGPVVNRANYCCDYSKAAYRKRPVDLVILSGLLSAGHRVAAVDGAARGFDAEAFLRRLRGDPFDAVVALVGSLTREADGAFLARLREALPSATLVATGDVCRFEPAATLRDMPALDAVLLDFTSPSLPAFLAGGRDLPNLLSRRDGRADLAPVREASFDIPPPLHELFDSPDLRPALALRSRVAETLFSFGCPHACRFCPMERVGWVPRSLPSARAELRRIGALGYREVRFCDATFAADRAWAEDLLGFLAAECRLDWWASTRVDLLDADLLRRMARAGCHTLTLGVETASDGVNRALAKGITADQARRAFALCREAGIRTLAHLILGLPGESPADLDRTLALVDELDPDYVSCNVMEAWPHTTFGDGHRRRHGERAVQVPGTSFPYPEEACPPLDAVLEARSRCLRRFYLSPRRWARYAAGLRTPYEALKLARNGLEVLGRLAGGGRRVP